MRLPLSLFFVPFLAHIHCEDVFGIAGENFTFPVKTNQKIVEIIWTKNKNKVAVWEGQNETTYFDLLKNRGFLSKETASLTIFNLENSDAGTYVLDYRDSLENDNVFSFILSVFAPPSEPEISCNISDVGLLLKCTTDFQKPLNYVWKFSSIPGTRQTQEVFIPKEKVDASEKVACFIKFSQTQKSSEISLAQCYPDEKGYSYHKRSRVGLTVGLLVPFLLISVAVIVLVCQYKRGKTKLGTGRAAQKNSPVHDPGERELLCLVDNQEQPNSDRATPSQAVDDENEKPEADKEVNEEDSALEDKEPVANSVNQEDISKKENSSLLTKHADDCDANEGEVTSNTEGGNGDHLSNSPSCSEGLIPLLNYQPSNCIQIFAEDSVENVKKTLQISENMDEWEGVRTEYKTPDSDAEEAASEMVMKEGTDLKQDWVAGGEAVVSCNN